MKKKKQDFYSKTKIISQDQGLGQDFGIQSQGQGQDLNFCPRGHSRQTGQGHLARTTRRLFGLSGYQPFQQGIY